MFRIFSVQSHTDTIEREFNHPSGLSFSKIMDIFSEILSLLLAPGGILMVITFLWGYTGTFGGDSGFGRFAFWVLLFVNGFIFVVVRIAISAVNKMKDKMDTVENVIRKDIYVTYDSDGKEINNKH